MATSIVVGGTGILGRAIVLALGKDANQWGTVYAFSRSKKENFPSKNVQQRHIDLTSPAEGMAKDLKDIQAEYVIFCAYLQKDTEQENWDVNGAMLQNLLTALELTDAVSSLKRIILVTGAKQYNLQHGPPKQPMQESDPWLRDEPWGCNFYFRQQDLLHAFCEKHSHIQWVVTYPNDVIGVAKGNFMNLATSVGIYASVSREMGQQLAFPGSETFYTSFDSFTSSKLHASFCLWAAKEPKAGNHAFNVVNGDAESWQNLWPRLAERYGIKVQADQFASAGLLPTSTALSDKPPVTALETEIGLVGRTQPGKIEARIDLDKWSQQEDVKRAWAKLAEREGLEKDAFDKATWSFLKFVLGRNYNIVISMSKARKFGWTGYEDTWDSLCDAFDELEKEKMLPSTH